MLTDVLFAQASAASCFESDIIKTMANRDDGFELSQFRLERPLSWPPDNREIGVELIEQNVLSVTFTGIALIRSASLPPWSSRSANELPVISVWPECIGSNDIPAIRFMLLNAGERSVFPEICNDLVKDFSEFSEGDWDGMGAEPISAETIEGTREALKLLPPRVPEPDIAPASDGSIGLEWVGVLKGIPKIFIDIGPGKVFRAYRRSGDGSTLHIPLQSIDLESGPLIASLFHPGAQVGEL